MAPMTVNNIFVNCGMNQSEERLFINGRVPSKINPH